MKFLKSGLIPVICLTIALSGCGGEEARKASFLKKGKTYLAEGNYDKAKIEFKNVLQIDPKYAEGYYMMGMLEEGRKNLRPAFANYQKAVTLDPTHIKAQAKLGQFQLMSGNTDKAKETLDTITALDPQSIDGKLLKLIIMSRAKDKTAISFAKKLLAEDPKQIEIVRILALLHIRNNDQNKAIKVLDEGIANIPDDASLRVQLAAIYGQTKDFDNVEILLKEIVALDPEKLEPRAKLASFYAKYDELDKAEKTLQELISIDPTDVNRYLLLVDFQIKRKSVGEAEKTLLSAIKKFPEKYKLRFVLAELYTAISSSKAEDVYQEIIKLNGFEAAGLQARNKLAEIALSQNDIEGASQLINVILDKNSRDNNALLLKGRIAAFRKDYDTAIVAFRTVVKDQPDSVESVSLLAISHLKNNEPELAEEVLRQGIDSAPDNPKMYINYANYLKKSGEVNAAEKEIDKLLSISPKNLEALKMKVNFAIARRDMGEVRTMIEKIKTAHPGNPEGYQKMGDYYTSNKQYPKAFEEYESALKRSKTLLPSLASITKLYLLQKQYNQAITRLNKVIKEQPKDAIPLELLGEVYIAQKKFAKAEKEIKKAINLNNKWPLPYTSLVSIYLAQNNIEGAIRIYQQALEVLPKNTRIMSELAQIYERKNEPEKAMSTYERILTIEPASALAANNLAVLLAEVKGDTASLQRAKELAMRFEQSTQPGFLDTIGWIYYKTGEFEKSLPILEKVVEKTRNVPIFQYRLGMAYYKTGNQDAAKTHLSKAIESGKKFQGHEEAKKVLSILP